MATYDFLKSTLYIFFSLTLMLRNITHFAKGLKMLGFYFNRKISQFFQILILYYSQNNLNRLSCRFFRYIFPTKFNRKKRSKKTIFKNKTTYFYYIIMHL